MRTLTVFLNDQPVGMLSEGDDLWCFAYDAQWAQSPGGFDLAPGLPRTQRVHQDGGTFRPVQWYFDNLLPEETLRETVSKEAGIKGDDAFALLAYLGAESAGSLVLLPTGEQAPPRIGLQALCDATLSQHIRNLPRASLSSGAPKPMSVAGAHSQAQPTSDDYPSSVINEYLVQRLAGRLGLQAHAVYHRYVPEPVYLIERFDRYTDEAGRTQRRHIIDACQLLNKPRGFKNKSANLQTLSECVDQCRNRASARLRLYRWLMFNLLVGNDDNHLKNISFMVSAEGIDLSPPYDMLSTSVYRTVAFADQRPTWPEVEMMIPLPGATHFSQVTRESLLQPGEALGLPRRISERELDRMAQAFLPALEGLIQEIEQQNAGYTEAVRMFLGGELRVVRAIQHIVVPYMLERVAGPKKS